MNTPIRDFVISYCHKNTVRLHMPGHKGESFVGAEKYDITEIDGADVLYSAQGIIKESEENAASLFGAFRTFYSCEGSSLCIKAMLAIIACSRKNKNRKTKILAPRNVHKAFVYACALCDIDVEWIYPSEPAHLCTCRVSPSYLEERLSQLGCDFDAVYITSPDYLGHCSDVRGLAEICDRYSLPLLVDNAHGAYLAFLDESMHPIKNGAYMCCDSAHKTLPVLTGGAYLHLSEKASDNADYAENMMSLMGSTSPSYLILQSLDLCNKYISDGYKEKLGKIIDNIERLKLLLASADAFVEKTEPLKLVLNFRASGVSVNDMILSLSNEGIVAEFYDDEHIVFMFTPENSDDDFLRLRKALLSLKYSKSYSEDSFYYGYTEAERAISIRNAVFSSKETLPVEKSEGRICATPAVSCPPAVPPVICGEIISASAIECMKRYGIKKIEVVR